jgi:hypothetical protein
VDARSGAVRSSMTIRSGRAASPHANGVFSTGVTMRQWTGTFSTTQAWRSGLNDALGTTPTEEYQSIRRRWRQWARRCRRAACGRCEMPGEHRAKRATGLIYVAVPVVMTGLMLGVAAWLLMTLALWALGVIHQGG